MESPRPHTPHQMSRTATAQPRYTHRPGLWNRHHPQRFSGVEMASSKPGVICRGINQLPSSVTNRLATHRQILYHHGRGKAGGMPVMDWPISCCLKELQRMVQQEARNGICDMTSDRSAVGGWVHMICTLTVDNIRKVEKSDTAQEKKNMMKKLQDE